MEVIGEVLSESEPELGVQILQITVREGGWKRDHGESPHIANKRGPVGLDNALDNEPVLVRNLDREHGSDDQRDVQHDKVEQGGVGERRDDDFDQFEDSGEEDSIDSSFSLLILSPFPLAQPVPLVLSGGC